MNNHFHVRKMQTVVLKILELLLDVNVIKIKLKLFFYKIMFNLESKSVLFYNVFKNLRFLKLCEAQNCRYLKSFKLILVSLKNSP